jgi:hypothetical protein
MSQSSRKGASNLRGTFGGTAVVCCIHQIEKRQKVALMESDRPDAPKPHYAHVCSCCENMFIKLSPEASFCPACGGMPLPDLPEGVRV